MITATGWTPYIIDDLPFRDVLDLVDYWNDYPPIHMLFRGFVGYEGRKKKKEQVEEPTPMDQIMLQALPGTPVSALPDWQRSAIERVLKEKKGDS